MSGNSKALSRADAKETFNPADNFRGQPRPEHHLHRDSEPLPGSNSTAYGQDQHRHAGVWENRRDIGVTGIHQGTPEFQDSSFSRNAFSSERPLNIQSTDQGGVAVDGRGDLLEGHANVTDKLIGKLQKVTRKYMNKPELHEKGELRESGGKLAVVGEARVPCNEAQL
ncbi:hypothetical protein BDM02DRAFT_3129866 [Thelephora ganbajun]|uniref:Uncharacterized protein n=1 Tax=Thelephora ganbajun TaxID=370292 RepID=A0ACB6ZC02_THEGA|nr:hypothetical protein BDM02DRAFT_3129866 [Thelephora ganbajun]